MGLVTHLLGWPVTGPAALVKLSLGSIRDSAIREVADETSVREALMELQLELELGEIDEAEYERREAEIMRRLREVRAWRRRLGLPIRGGAVTGRGSGGGRTPRESRGDGE